MSADETVDVAYLASSLRDGELIHGYGDRVHILSDPYHLSLLATLSASETTQPLVNHLVGALYRDLIARVASREFPRRMVARNTRMIDVTPKGVFRGEIIDPSTRAVCVDVARVGSPPSPLRSG